ncbi:hypothetical protein [Lysinibacillus capsici]|uniref:hypothetical protein n=1 Tax=Lysinibacillus capsici TaxID=2115968 RepID=UPI003BAD88FB
MDISIYIKLVIANKFGKVKIKPKFKHLDYMLENNFVLPIYDGWAEVHGFSMPTHSDRYTITSDGKKAMWDKGNLLVTRIIAWLALLISLTALLVNYIK